MIIEGVMQNTIPIITLIIVLVSYYLIDLGVCTMMNINFKKKQEKNHNEQFN